MTVICLGRRGELSGTATGTNAQHPVQKEYLTTDQAMNTENSQDAKLFSRNFIALASINFLIMVGYYLLFVISVPYAEEQYGVSPGMAGLVAGSMILGILAGRFVTGGVIERVGFLRMLYLGLFLYCASMLLYLNEGSLLLLLCNRFFGGVGVGCISTMTGTLVARIIPPARFGQGVSYFSMSTVLGLAIGPFFGLTLMELVSYTVIFLLCLGLGLCSFCIAAFLRVELPPDDEEEAGETAPGAVDEDTAVRMDGNAAPGSARDASGPSLGRRILLGLHDYIEPKAIPVALVIMAAALCYAGVQSFISSYAKEIDQVAASTLFFLVYALVALASRPVSGKLFDSKGENAVVYPAIFFMACSQLLLSMASAPWMVLLSGGLLALGYGNLISIFQALVVKLSPRRRFGQATSTYFIFLDLGIGLGPSGLGYLVPFTGYSGMFMVTAVIGFLVFPLYYFLHGKRARRIL